MTVLAIDPGSAHSAFVLLDGEIVLQHGKVPNGDLRLALREKHSPWGGAVLVVERMASYGMAVGAEVYDTVWWAGRFHEVWIENHRVAARMFRADVKLHLCGSRKAKDANVRQAVIDRFGGKDRAIGRKASQGPLYGVTADRWQALALGLAWHDCQVTRNTEAVCATSRQ